MVAGDLVGGIALGGGGEAVFQGEGGGEAGLVTVGGVGGADRHLHFVCPYTMRVVNVVAVRLHENTRFQGPHSPHSPHSWGFRFALKKLFICDINGVTKCVIF